MRPESDHITPTEKCPNPHLWSARDCEGSETEVGDFLYGLVRLVKPHVVVETGAYMGDTTRRIGHGLRDNGFGYLLSCDTNTELAVYVGNVLDDLPVTVSIERGIDLLSRVANVDLAFIDSNGDRIEECKTLQMSPNGFVVVHDMNWKILNPIRELGWKEIFFPTPRGISLFKVN